MNDREHILISLAPRHADNIFAGRKLVELRRRTVNVSPGTTIWIYVKRPVGSLIGRVTLVHVHASSPSSLWRSYGAISGLSRREFFDYFEGVAKGVALILEGARRLDRSLSLESLRELEQDFHPPQFFSRLSVQHPLVRAATATLSA